MGKKVKNRGVSEKLENWKTPTDKLSGFFNRTCFDALQAASLLKLSKLSNFSKNSNFSVFQLFNRGGLFLEKVKNRTPKVKS